MIIPVDPDFQMVSLSASVIESPALPAVNGSHLQLMLTLKIHGAP